MSAYPDALFPVFDLVTAIAIDAIRVIRAALLITEVFAATEQVQHCHNCENFHNDLREGDGALILLKFSLAKRFGHAFHDPLLEFYTQLTHLIWTSGRSFMKKLFVASVIALSALLTLSAVHAEGDVADGVRHDVREVDKGVDHDAKEIDKGIKHDDKEIDKGAEHLDKERHKEDKHLDKEAKKHL